MSRRFINELSEHENLDQIYQVADKQLRANRQGNLYLQMRVSDRTGTMTALLWNATESLSASFEAGDYLRIKAATHVHNGTLQMIASRIDKIDATQVDESEFVIVNSEAVGKLSQRVAEILRSLTNVHLRNLAECFLIDDSFMAKFMAAPAGVKNHHAYRGGLIEHVVSLMEVVRVVAPLYPSVDPELLLMGAFLHDLGKVDELTYERDLGYSDEGQLIGHVVMGVGMLEKRAAQAEHLSGEPFPEEMLVQLKHMIVSHHGELEFGSPKVPMTLEAVALHFLDNLDAKLHSYGQLIREDPSSDSRWTPFHAAIGRKLYKRLDK